MKLIMYIGPLIIDIEAIVDRHIHNYKDQIFISDRYEMCASILELFYTVKDEDKLFVSVANYLCSYLWSEIYQSQEDFGKVSDLIISYLKDNKPSSTIREHCLSLENKEPYFIFNLGVINHV